MKYEATKEYIENIPKFTTKNTKEHTKRFLELLGRPDEQVKVIHVAGTNGKGSTCAYINAILCSMKIATGLFTSPHLIEMTERIKINGKDVSEDEFVQSFHKVKAAVQRMAEETLPHPTFFEFLFGMAMVSFVRNKVEYVVLETGLGGRLDATNIVKHPVLNCITTIGLDHTQYLGDTIQQIAMEKAGIIKPGARVVYDGREQIVEQVVEEICKKNGNTSRKIADDAYEILEIDGNGIAFYLKNSYDKHGIWKLKSSASYQVINASIALTALIELFEPDDEMIEIWKEALYASYWNGRMEEVEPDIYLDGAHNLNAIEAVMKDQTKWDVILFSVVEDKSYEAMIKYLCEKDIATIYVITRVDNERAVDTKQIKEVFERYTKRPLIVEDEFDLAWQMAKGQKKDGKMLCMGSLYLVGMAQERYR